MFSDDWWRKNLIFLAVSLPILLWGLIRWMSELFWFAKILIFLTLSCWVFDFPKAIIFLLVFVLLIVLDLVGRKAVSQKKQAKLNKKASFLSFDLVTWFIYIYIHVSFDLSASILTRDKLWAGLMILTPTFPLEGKFGLLLLLFNEISLCGFHLLERCPFYFPHLWSIHAKEEEKKKNPCSYLVFW